MDSRWRILILLFLARTGLGYQFQVLGSVSPQLIDELGFNYRETGTLIGLFMMAGIILSFPAGLAGRCLSDRFMVGSGLTILAIGGFISSFGSTFYLIGLGRLICGVGFVLGTIYFAKMIADWFSGKELATAMGVLVMSWPIGIALGQLLHPLLAASYGYSAAFQVAAVYCVGGAAAVLLLYRNPEKPDSIHTGNTPPTGQTSKLSPQQWKLTLTAAAAWGFFNAGYVVYLSFSQKLIADNGFSLLQASAIASLPSWIMLISGIIAGQIADRTGRRDLLLYGCMLAAILSMLMLKDSRLVIAGAIIFGIMGMAPAGIIMALTADAMPVQARAFGMGVFFTIYFLIVMPAPAIAGWLFDLTGKSFLPLQFAAILFFATAAANFMFRKLQTK